jgi:serine/threonine protein kinase
MTVGEGTVLGGRYILGRLLGRGGMADVFQASDEVLHREVAVKVLRETAEDSSAQARFTAEGRTLAKLSHRSLVTVLDAGVEGELPFLVLHLVEGPSLSEVLKSERLPFERVARIGADVADALSHVHQHGIVHRDVKPGNVLLTLEGKALLADFGIARLVEDATRHTQTGLTIGTVAYLSPEQVRGEGVTTASDVYSLGLVLLEALTGRPTYEGPATEAALARLHSSPTIPEDLPAACRDVIAAMTDMDPTARPEAAQVAAVLRGQAVEDRRGSTRVMPIPVAKTVPVTVAERAPVIDVAPATTTGPSAAWSGRGSVVLAAVVGVLVLGVVLFALLRGTPAETDAQVPDGVPTRLQEPLANLHDAVEGEG